MAKWCCHDVIRAAFVVYACFRLPVAKPHDSPDCKDICFLMFLWLHVASSLSGIVLYVLTPGSLILDGGGLASDGMCMTF